MPKIVAALEAAEAVLLSDERTDTVPCRFCAGSGRIPADACSEIVNGRPCRGKVIPDPAYYDQFPERTHLRGYCGMHRNARLRTAQL
jgi:hypothetical protein